MKQNSIWKAATTFISMISSYIEPHAVDRRRHLNRIVRSIADRFIFCHIRLEPLTGFVFFLSLCGTIMSFVLKWGLLLVAIPVFTIFWVIYSKFLRNPSLHYPRNFDVFSIILEVFPTKREQELGFTNLPRPRRLAGSDAIEIVPHGSIIISEQFNADYVMNPNWNPRIIVDETNAAYRNVIRHLRSEAETNSKIIQNKCREALFSKLPLINEEKIAISSGVENFEHVHVYKTDYFSGMLTANLTANDVDEYTSDGSKTISYAMKRLPFHQRNSKYELSHFEDLKKGYSHHLGIDVLAVTEDFCLPLMIQGGHTQVSQGLLAPTGSGSVDWEDQAGLDRLKDVLKIAGKRELREEVTKQTGNPQLWNIENMCPIGYFRMPHRAGKPQFVCVAKLNNNSGEIGPNREATQSTKSTFLAVRSLEDLNYEVSKLINDGHPQYQLSVPLYGALVCLHHALSRNPEYVAAALGYLAESTS